MRFTTIVCLFALLLASQSGAAPVRQEVTFDIGRARLTAVSWGSGEAVILLPGVGRSSDSFETFGPQLADRGFRAIALNLRGIKGSTGELSGLTLHDYARDIADVARQLGDAPVHLLGWAQGNRFARTVATDYPGVVRSVVLIAAGGKVPGDREASGALTRLYEPGLAAEERRRLMQTALFAPGSDPTPFLSLWASVPASPRASQAAANQATPLADWWLGGTAPMLVIQGVQDRIAPAANARTLKADAPSRVRLEEIENAGHAVLLEHPARVLDLISDFLAEHRMEASR